MSAPAALVCAKLVYPDTDQIMYKDNTEDAVLEVLTNNNQANPEDGAYSNPSFITETTDTSFTTINSEPDIKKEQLNKGVGKTNTDIDGNNDPGNHKKGNRKRNM